MGIDMLLPRLSLLSESLVKSVEQGLGEGFEDDLQLRIHGVILLGTPAVVLSLRIQRIKTILPRESKSTQDGWG